MNTVRLYYPVHTLDNQLLLPAGAVLSKKTFKKIGGIEAESH